MTDREHECEFKPVPEVLYGLAGATAVAVIVGLAAFAVPRPADALPAYASQTKLACGSCHVNPAGGGARTALGNAFAANGHKLPSKTGKTSKTSAPGEAPSSSTVAAPAASYYATPSEYAQAGAWSLEQPYYSLFLYSPSDYESPAEPAGGTGKKKK